MLVTGIFFSSDSYVSTYLRRSVRNEDRRGLRHINVRRRIERFSLEGGAIVVDSRDGKASELRR